MLAGATRLAQSHACLEVCLSQVYELIRLSSEAIAGARHLTEEGLRTLSGFTQASQTTAIYEMDIARNASRAEECVSLLGNARAVSEALRAKYENEVCHRTALQQRLEASRRDHLMTRQTLVEKEKLDLHRQYLLRKERLINQSLREQLTIVRDAYASLEPPTDQSET